MSGSGIPLALAIATYLLAQVFRGAALADTDAAPWVVEVAGIFGILGAILHPLSFGFLAIAITRAIEHHVGARRRRLEGRNGTTQ